MVAIGIHLACFDIPMQIQLRGLIVPKLITIDIKKILF